MKTVSRLFVGLIVASGLVIHSGCGKEKVDVPKTSPVSIKIAYQGKAVEGANVTLVPQEQSGRGASGVTDATGVAKMALPGLADGAMPGKYRVTVSKVDTAQSGSGLSAEEYYKQQSGKTSAAPSAPKQILPAKYLSAESGKLECVVTDQPNQVFEFNLTD